MNRRTLLKTLGASTSVALAGCTIKVPGDWGTVRVVQENDSTPRPTSTSTQTQTQTETQTPIKTVTETPTETSTETPISTPTKTDTQTEIQTSTETPTQTPTPTDTPTNTPTDTPTNTPTDTPTNTPTDTPTNTPTVRDIKCNDIPKQSISMPTLCTTKEVREQVIDDKINNFDIQKMEIMSTHEVKFYDQNQNTATLKNTNSELSFIITKNNKCTIYKSKKSINVEPITSTPTSTPKENINQQVQQLKRLNKEEREIQLASKDERIRYVQQCNGKYITRFDTARIQSFLLPPWIIQLSLDIAYIVIKYCLDIFFSNDSIPEKAKKLSFCVFKHA